MNNDYNKEPDVERLISGLSNLLCFTSQHNWPSTRILALKQLSLELSSYLPQVSDSTLFEIDDLIYGEDNTTVVAGTRIPSEATVKFLTEECYRIYHEFFFVMIQEIGREAEMVFLQLLELVPDDIYEKIFFDPQLYMTLQTLMICNHPSHFVERYLKALKVAMNSHKKVFQHHIKAQNYNLFDNDFEEYHFFISLPLVLSWTNESEYKHPSKKRWASWISEQSASILENLALEKYNRCSDIIDYIRKYKHHKEIVYGREYVSIVSICHYHLTSYNKRSLFGSNKSLLIRHLFKFFMSTQDNDQKIQRIYDYIQGLYLVANISSDEYKNLEPFQSFTYSQAVVRDFYDIWIEVERYPSLKLMKVIKYYGYCVGSSSYLSKKSLPSSYMTFIEKTNELMDKYFGDFDNFEVDETSFGEIEELSCFHDFMKGLQLMDILYIAWLMLKDMIPAEYLHFYSNYESARLKVFMTLCCSFKDHIIDFNDCPEYNPRIFATIQVIFRMCPYLVISHNPDTPHMENIIKRLSGGNIGKANEALHFMLIQHSRE